MVPSASYRARYVRNLPNMIIPLAKLYNAVTERCHFIHNNSIQYFATSAWPSEDAISSECGEDQLFLALYNELTHRHLHSVSRIQLRDRLNGWRVYTDLFDRLIAEPDKKTLCINSVWAFDIMHEFVYQFQGFCQFRTNEKKKEDDLALLKANKDAWAVEKVMYYLSKLIEISSSADENVGSAYKNLGVFAVVALSRLECLLADYTECLSALSTLHSQGTMEVVDSVLPAKISLVYHVAVAYLMLRRYKDAANTLEEICIELQRGLKTGQLRSHLAGADQSQFFKQLDRMLALLAILTHICPAGVAIENASRDSIGYMIRDKFGSQLLKIEGGEEGYEDLFAYACPKFIDPAVPDYSKPLPSSLNQETYNIQIRHFMNEMAQQQSLRKLRSYMKLYSSIGTEKLAAFNDCASSSEFSSRLLSLKHKMSQKEGADDEFASALDIHYYVVGDTVHIDEYRQQRRFESAFLGQISQCEDIAKELEAVVIKSK